MGHCELRDRAEFAASMHLSPQRLRKIDDAYLRSLDLEALRGLSLRLLADLQNEPADHPRREVFCCQRRRTPGGVLGRTLAVQFWFDFASTYSYPAAWRVETLARQQRVPVEWKAFLLGPIFQAQGWNDSPFNLFPVQGRYMWRDLERICADLDLPFRRPSQFPRNSVLAARIAGRFGAEPWLPDFARAVFRANFAEDRDIAQPVVLERCLAALGLPGAELLQEVQSPDGKAQFRARTEHAVALGIFGAPTFVVGDELFWGNDRLEPALAWAVRRGDGPGRPGVQPLRSASP
jgi:2-hydroxychromene-2-carboxylate isomerase